MPIALVTTLVALLCLGASGQDRPEASVFRAVARGRAMPELTVTARAGNKEVLSFAQDGPTLLAFLRPDQEDSMRVLADLERLALGPDSPEGRIVVVGLVQRDRDWKDRAKGLPKRIEFYQDEHGAAKAVGLLVVPSVAVLDRDGSLRRSHVLHDPEFFAKLRRDLADAGSPHPATDEAAETRRRRYDELGANAAGLEASGKLDLARTMRERQLELGIDSAEVHRHLGQLALALGQTDSAIAHLEKSVDLAGSLSARIALGRALAAAGRLDDAEQRLTQVLQLVGENADAHHALAEIAHQRGDIDRALFHIKAALAAVGATAAGGGHEKR